MASKNKNTGPIILALILLTIITYFLVLLLQKFWSVAKEANPTVIAALLGGSATITVSIISIFIGRYLERKKIIEAEIRNKKLPIYEEFIKGIITWTMKKDEDKTTDELLPLIYDFSQKVVIWGNQKVIPECIEFRLNSTKSNTKNIMVVFEELLLEIRKDVGQDNSELVSGDLMSIFINDYKEYILKLEIQQAASSID